MTTPDSGRGTPSSDRVCVGGVPIWLLLLIVIAVSANLVAAVTTNRTIELMQGISPFAQEVRRGDDATLPYWRVGSYAFGIATVFWYVLPVIVHFRRGAPTPAPDVVQ